jgi:putative 4-mercaptohistidine N1-methyltranferase
MARMNPYETDKLLHEYLLFHYGKPEEVLPWAAGPREALDYPVRCVGECLDAAAVPTKARALDVGCAVGRSSFELARHCAEVIGVDYSRRFIEAAQVLASSGSLAYLRMDEGSLTTPLLARVPTGVERGRVRFEHGDAHALRGDLGAFDVVLGANLVDRLANPAQFLGQLARLVKPGGQLILTTPCTWLEDFTPAKNWLGGFFLNNHPRTTLDGLRTALGVHFDFAGTRDLPFLIREHARKYQWSVALATMWRRKAG